LSSEFSHFKLEQNHHPAIISINNMVFILLPGELFRDLVFRERYFKNKHYLELGFALEVKQKERFSKES
jgi:hypothetical protein